MVPVVGLVAELDDQKAIAKRVHDEVCAAYAVKAIPHLYGTMIEIPRAALTADRIAATAEFFSFGTNDLTQMSFGFSRDDIGGFVPEYLEKKLLPADPFQVLDREGVGQLVEMGINRGRATRPKLKVGICGEHGGEPSSVEFCHIVGMDYVSCSPFRVPIARLAAAQAQLTHPRGEKTGAGAWGSGSAKTKKTGTGARDSGSAKTKKKGSVVRGQGSAKTKKTGSGARGSGSAKTKKTGAGARGSGSAKTKKTGTGVRGSGSAKTKAATKAKAAAKPRATVVAKKAAKPAAKKVAGKATRRPAPARAKVEAKAKGRGKARR